MLRSLRVLRNVVTNYLRYFVGGLIGFLITPFMVHALGDGDYGLWVTVFSLTGYFGLIDQGIRPSLVRYVSRAQAANDREDLARTLASALALYTTAGLLVLAATAVAAANFGAWFKIDPSQLDAARTTVILAGVSLALGFPFGVYGATLSGLQRYDVANWLGIGIGILRAVLFVIALRLGGGVVELAWMSLGANLLGHLLSWIAVRRLLPGVPVTVTRVTREHLARVGSYGGFAFIGALATLLSFQTDALVITAFLGAAMVTPFALAAGLVENVRSLVYSATFVLSPTASEMETLGENDKLHAMLLAGAKYSILLSWPVLLALVVFGENLLVTWVGAAYATTASWAQVLTPGGPPASAAQLLTLLTLPTLLALPQSAASSVLFGISRHKGVVFLSILNALLNLGLSIAFVKPLGLAGVALGTAIPLAVISGVITAWYAARALDLPMRRYLWEGMFRPGLIALTFLIPAVAAQTLWRPTGWLALGLACFLSWLFFVAIAWRFGVSDDERRRWLRMLPGALGTGRATPAAPSPSEARP